MKKRNENIFAPISHFYSPPPRLLCETPCHRNSYAEVRRVDAELRGVVLIDKTQSASEQNLRTEKINPDEMYLFKKIVTLPR